MKGPTCDVAVRAAQAAAAHLKERVRSATVVKTKGQGDFVTTLDLEVEALIKRTIQEAFPSHQFLAEESASEPLSDQPTWVVDPVDGTLNLAYGFPFFSVSIGLVERRQPVLGVVTAPLLDELFVARAGAGATLNGQPITIQVPERLSDALVALDLGHADEAASQSLALGVQLRPHVAALRLMGSAALALAYVAAGRLSGFFHHRLDPWDMAAGLVLVQEAGGLTVDLAGKPVTTLSRGPLVVGSPPVVEAVLRALRGG
jgi:myo-inositol-1(or 4)-monophosphatase